MILNMDYLFKKVISNQTNRNWKKKENRMKSILILETSSLITILCGLCHVAVHVMWYCMSYGSMLQAVQYITEGCLAKTLFAYQNI